MQPVETTRFSIMSVPMMTALLPIELLNSSYAFCRQLVISVNSNSYETTAILYPSTAGMLLDEL
jgi:hypothetical protein